MDVELQENDFATAEDIAEWVNSSPWECPVCGYGLGDPRGKNCVFH